MNHPAVARRLEPSLGLGTEPAYSRSGRLDVVAHAFLGKVERDLEAGDDVDESGLEAPDLVGEPARERARRQSDGAIGPRADHQRHGLGLSKVEAAIEERAARELSGRRQARAAGDEPLHDHPQQRRRSVTRELDDVLAGIGARRPHDRAQRRVDALAALGIDDGDAPQRVRRQRRERGRGAEQGSDDRDRVGATHANDPDRALADRRRDGDDRVVGARALRPGWRPWPRASRGSAPVGP